MSILLGVMAIVLVWSVLAAVCAPRIGRGISTPDDDENREDRP
jgi:hypothetical protein